MPSSPTRRTVAVGLLTTLGLLAGAVPAEAGVVFGLTGSTLAGGFRWDAAPRTLGGLERSLDDGLRYSVSGGSYQAFRDSYTWSGTAPSVAAFQGAVEQAFGAWTTTDPVTGVRGMFTFRPDFGTAVNTAIVSNVRQGAEIDIHAFNFGDTGTRGDTFFSAVGGSVTLTSGTTGYAAAPISGADIRINNNPGAVYTLDLFRRLLTHEIGHAIGLGDVEGDFNPGAFIDDNLDVSSSSAALATLTNSWALLVNPLDPSASSGLFRTTAPYADPGVLTTGVDLLMESRGLGIAPGNPIGNQVPLTNDEYGTRQILYPDAQPVPEPAALLALGAGTVGLLRLARRRRAE